MCDRLMEARRVDGVRTPRSAHHEEDGLDRSFIREPPFLRLQVVAGAALLFFGHRFVLRLAAAACSGLGLWLALCRSWLFRRADSVLRLKSAAR